LISATITTFNGKKVNIRIPESGKEIPLKRYFYAKYVFDQINELFGDEKPLNEFSFLKLVVEFLGQVLDIEPNVIMGFNIYVIKVRYRCIVFHVKTVLCEASDSLL